MSNLPAAYTELEPAEVWRHFGALNAIPRPSGHEEAARAYVQRVAEGQHAKWKNDARGNICVSVQARGTGTHLVDAEPIVLQSHLDMVCQKRPEVQIDFDLDPITPRRQGDQIFASGTTLGADNGLGAALMLAVLTSPGLTHPPLELLFTVEEETGLFGAAHLDPELVRGRRLINLDSEDPDEITIGCAGGAGTTLVVPVQREAAVGTKAFRLVVGGLQGGHSGVQIHQPLANAIKLMSGLLSLVAQNAPGMRLVSLDGGTAHNAIPRDCVAEVVVPVAELDGFDAAVFTTMGRLEANWRKNEPALTVQSAPLGAISQTPLDAASTATILGLAAELPHGVIQMSERFAGKVQTSSNLAQVATSGSEFEWHVSNRSFLAADIEKMQSKVAALGHAANAQVTARDGYPGWEPRADSDLQRQTVAAFEAVTGETPKVEVVHAGLECGILSEKLPGLDAVSFGPLIRGAHTPEEWVSISSVELIWRVLIHLLASEAK